MPDQPAGAGVPATIGPPAPRVQDPVAAARQWLPGLALCGVIALAATLVAQVHGGPPLLYALLMGMTLHGVAQEGSAAAGIELCSRFLLRLGVALLGARIGADQVLALGWPAAALVVAAVASTLAGGVWLARRLGLSVEQGLVSGGATAICGASAALAISAVLPRAPAQERFTLLVVVCVSSLSTLAMLVYPLLAALAGWSAPQAGLFLGASIHDVAQVIGAAYLLGPVAGDTAVIVKLFRVALLVVVVAGIGLAARRWRGPAAERGAGRPPLLPWFLLLFVVLMGLHSLHLLPAGAEPVLADVSRACLLMAIAALGLKTALRSLADAGWRPLLLMLAETLWLAAAIAAGVALMPG